MIVIVAVPERSIGSSFKNTELSQLGKARQVKVGRENTIIVDGNGNKEDIEARVNRIKLELKDTSSEYDKEKLQERLAKLSGGVGVIQVGAATEIEMKEKKLRIEDALSATKAAVEEGILPGGGTAYVNVIPEVEKILKQVSDEEKIGVKIILKALEEPVQQIARNAGLEGAVILDRVKANKKGIITNRASFEAVGKTAATVNPYALLIMAAVTIVTKKLDTIKENQLEIIEYLKLQEESRIKGNIKTLQDISEQLKYNLNKVNVNNIVSGGATGQDSIYNALKLAQQNNTRDSLVLIHDGVRPNINPQVITDNIKCARENGNAITCTSCFETILAFSLSLFFSCF